MAFRSVENDNELMKEGEYEVYVKDCCRSETQSHIPVIKFEFVVRADSGIEQAYKNKHVFKNFFPDEETGNFPEEKIGKYANALGIPKGQEFELDDLIGRNCVIVIKHYTNEKTGEKKDCIFYTKSSKAEPYMNTTPVGGQDFADISEEDGELPF